MSKIALVDKRFLWNTPNAIYRIETAKGGPVYMRTSLHGQADHRAVVIVDAAKFLAAWQEASRERLLKNGVLSGPDNLPFLDESGWRADYKFSKAKDGFAQGIDNPVPLAEVGPFRSPDAKGPYAIGVTNGMTRTIWLLANGAQAFPVECSATSAQAIHANVGLKEFPVCTVEQLLGFMTWDYWLFQGIGT